MKVSIYNKPSEADEMLAAVTDTQHKKSGLVSLLKKDRNFLALRPPERPPPYYDLSRLIIYSESKVIRVGGIIHMLDEDGIVSLIIREIKNGWLKAECPPQVNNISVEYRVVDLLLLIKVDDFLQFLYPDVDLLLLIKVDDFLLLPCPDVDEPIEEEEVLSMSSSY